jgi:hypothetical protein
MLTFHQTKNGERRAGPLTGYALALLKQHAHLRHPAENDVFPSPTSTKRRHRIRDAWE